MASSRSESRVQMSTTLPYSGLAVPSMMPGISRILTAHLEDDRAGRSSDRVDRQAGEEEHDRGPEQQAHEGGRVVHEEALAQVRSSASLMAPASCSAVPTASW